MEPVQIPQRVIDRVLRRRGRLHAYESLGAPRTALLVVDLQVHFMREGSPSEMPSARAIVPTVNRLAGALRERGGHVVWVVSTYGPKEERNWPNLDIVLGEAAAAVFRGGLSEGAAGHAIWPELDVRDTDPVVHKNASAASSAARGASNAGCTILASTRCSSSARSRTSAAKRRHARRRPTISRRS